MVEGKIMVIELVLLWDYSERMLKVFGVEIEVDLEINSVMVNGLC